MVASINGRSQAAAALLRIGAFPDTQTKQKCETALHFAAFHGHREVCAVLLGAECSVSLINEYNENAWQTATNAGKEDCATLIREAEAAKSGGCTGADHQQAPGTKTQTREREESDAELSTNKRMRMTTTFRGIPSVETMRLREVEGLEVQFYRYCKEAGLRGTLHVLALRFCMVPGLMALFCVAQTGSRGL